MTKLYFIGGASGSGKTAIMPELQKILGSEIKVYDFDDIGVPEGADKNGAKNQLRNGCRNCLMRAKTPVCLAKLF